MLCPKDNTSLKKTILDKDLLYSCPKCNGLWLPQKTFSKLINDFYSKDFSEKLNQWDNMIKEENKKLWEEDKYSCPNHPSIKMSKHFYSGDSGVIIDTCKICNGLWIENKELKKIYDYITKMNPLEQANIILYSDKFRRDKERARREKEISNFASGLIGTTSSPKSFLIYIIHYLVKTILKELKQS